MRHLRLKHSLVLAALVLVGVVASAAAAARPAKGPCTLCITSGTFPAGFVCPFTVSFHDVVDRKFQIVYPNGLYFGPPCARSHERGHRGVPHL